MNGHRVSRIVIGFVALALGPTAWIFTLNAVPSFDDIKASHTADIVGVWLFTWGLTWTATICGAAIAWLCVAFGAEEAAEAREAARHVA